MTLETLKDKIIASGSITSRDVANLRTVVYKDGKVDRKEAEFVFQLKKELFSFGNLHAWNEFFVQAITDYVFDNDKTAMAISEEKATWLVSQIGEDEIIDSVEETLLKSIHKRVGENFPDELEEIQGHTKFTNKLGDWLLRNLIGNTKTARSLEYGVGKSGERKNDPFN